MRALALLWGDVRFQVKYGFYGLYLVFTLLYLVLLALLPAPWRETAAILMILTDPAALGLFFMGAIILFEKSERVLASLAVSPVKPGEYLAAKLGSLAILACLVAVVIATGGGLPVRYLLFVPGLILTSGLFSAVGLTIAARSTSLNRFILATIPAELLINIPAILYLFVWRSPWLLFHPGVCLIELSRDGAYAWPALLILLLWLIPAWLLTRRAVCRMFLTLEGIRL